MPSARLNSGVRPRENRRQTMTAIYTTLALSYRAWHYRMSTERLERWGPAAGFSAMQGLNAFSLLLLLQLRTVPDWLFVGIPFAVGFCAYWLVSRIYRAHAIIPTYANNLNVAVPGVREFPLVYAYLFGTFVFFFGCIYVAARGAA